MSVIATNNTHVNRYITGGNTNKSVLGGEANVEQTRLWGRLCVASLLRVPEKENGCWYGTETKAVTNCTIFNFLPSNVTSVLYSNNAEKLQPVIIKSSLKKRKKKKKKERKKERKKE